MSVVSHAALLPKRAPDAERRHRIIEAAHQAFVQHGFHAATMQHVAEAAGMSAGNLYRYFPSKEALVEGLCLSHQDERAANFARLASSADIAEALAALIKETLLNGPKEKARLILEIWAEAGRNVRVADITRVFDAAAFAGLEKIIEAAKASGGAPAGLQADFAARVIFTLVGGLFKRMALEPDFDPEVEAEMAIGMLRALFAGAIAPAVAAGA